MNEFITNFNAYAKDYPIVAGAISLWALGVGTFLMRAVPKRIFDFLIKHSTTNITLINSNDSFYQFLKWYDMNNFSKTARSIKITNGRWGYDSLAVKSIGYGNHYFIYKKKIIKLVMNKDNNTTSDKERDIITMTSLGRSHKIFDDIFEAIKQKNVDEDRLIISNFTTDGWIRSSEQHHRKMDTIFLKEGDKEIIKNYIENFQSKSQWNINMGIPHQTGILLYGPPGTGKTSIIKAIASEFDLKIFNLNASKLTSIESAFNSLPENSLVTIEDIDSDSATHSREDDKSPVLFEKTDLSDLLNSIDGLHCNHGRILIATTNHIEKLDRALIRDGRFDLKIEIGYVDLYILKQFMNRFYPNFVMPNDIKIKSSLSSAQVQKSIIDNLNNPEVVISSLCDKQHIISVSTVAG